MNLIQAIILGLIQGLTEFLPVSSSGHLVLGQVILGVDQGAKQEIGVAFEVFVHFGTLLAVLTVYWRDIVGMIKAFFSIFSFNRPSLEDKYHQDADFKMMVLILLGSFPAGVLGIALKDILEEAFTNPLLVCFMLIVTAGILFSTRYFLKENQQLGFTNSLIIGFAQAFAMLPGISRSGSTISTGLYMGLNRETAAKFSFLLSVPVIAGATILEFKNVVAHPPAGAMIINFIAGTLVAYLSGLVAIKFLLSIIKKGKLEIFAYYCLAAGIFGVSWLLMK
jgi:undecaprenyl-diphosphatase